MQCIDLLSMQVGAVRAEGYDGRTSDAMHVFHSIGTRERSRHGTASATSCENEQPRLWQSCGEAERSCHFDEPTTDIISDPLVCVGNRCNHLRAFLKEVSYHIPTIGPIGRILNPSKRISFRLVHAPCWANAQSLHHSKMRRIQAGTERQIASFI